MKKFLFFAAILISISQSISAKPIYFEDEFLNLYFEKYAIEVELEIIKDEAKVDRDKLNERISQLNEQIVDLSQNTGSLKVEKDNIIEKLHRNLDDLQNKSADDQRLAQLRIKDLEKRMAILKGASGSRERQLIDDQKAQETRFLTEIASVKNNLENERVQGTKEIIRLNDELLQWKQLNEIQSRKLADIESQAKSMEEALKKEIQDGSLRIKRLKDRLVINIDDKILFDSGSASLKPEVKKTLDTIADILQKYRESRIIIEGHTDNVPIHNYQFRDNWQLSTERALSVLNQILKKTELNSKRFSAQGFGEYNPSTSNETEKNRQMNRRVDIVVLPDR